MELGGALTRTLPATVTPWRTHTGRGPGLALKEYHWKPGCFVVVHLAFLFEMYKHTRHTTMEHLDVSAVQRWW